MVTTTTGIATSFIQFSRASNATVTNNVGNIAWAGHNLLLGSEQFDGVNWAKVQTSVSANSISSPDGTITADKITALSGAGTKYLGNTTATASGVSSFSVFAKKDTQDFIQLLNAGDGQAYCNFDISTGVVGTAGTKATGSIVPLGNGWFMCTVTFAADTTYSTGNRIYLVASNSAGFASSITAAGTEAVYLWGAHLYRSDLGGMVFNPAQPAGFGTYYPTTPKNLLGYTENWGAGWNTINGGLQGDGVELVTNGDFATDTDWTKGTGWTISGGVASFSAGTGSELQQTGRNFAANTTYKITFNMTQVSGGGFRFIVDTTGSFVSSYFNTTATHTLVFSVGATSTRLRLGALGGADFSIDNISIQKTSVYEAPNGLQTARAIEATAANGTLLSSLSLLASPYTFSIWLKRKTGGGDVQLTVDGTTYATVAVTDTWTRFSTTLTPTAGTKTPGIRLVTSGDAVYAWGAQLSDSASIDPYSPNYAAAPTASAYYAPRLDYDPVNVQPRGLLVEEQRTNLALYSNDFTQSAWTKINLTNVTNKTSGPDAASNSATLLNEDTVNSEHGISQTFSKAASAITYTLSCFAKVGVGRTRITMAGYSNTESGNGTFAPFDLSGGQAGSLSNRGSGWAGSTSSITPISNGWYRCTLTVTTSTGTDIVFQILNDSGSGTATQSRLYAGTVGNGCYVYGAQVEASSPFPTSYIPTGASTVTRSADVASVSTQAFPYSATEGTLVLFGDSLLQSASLNLYRGLVLTDSASTDTNSAIGLYVYNQTALARVLNGGVSQASYSAGTLTINANFKAAMAYKTDDIAASLNGAAVVTDTSATIPTGIIVLSLGGPTGYLNGHIRQITYIPRRLSNTELQTRTTL